jgi:hypothetical protein
MRIDVPHHTTREKARRRIEERLEQLVSQFGGKADQIERDWEGDRLRFRGKAKGMKIEGTLEVTDSEVIIDGKLPLMAKPFEPRIREAVRKEADAIFRTA